MKAGTLTTDAMNQIVQEYRKVKKLRIPKVKVVIPVFNEEKTIQDVISRVDNVLSKLELAHEILVIDDGSTDGTLEILQQMGVPYSKNVKNRGKGYSLQKGFHLAGNKDYVITIDGDGEHAPEDLPALLFPALMNKTDMVIGSRFISYKNLGRGTYLNNQKKLSHLRKFGNWLFSLFTWIFTQQNIKDSQSGYRVFRPGLVKKLNLKSHGFMIETEIMLQLMKQGYRVMEVPIHNGRPLRGSYMNILNDSVKIILTIFRESFPKKVSPLLDSIIDKFT